MAIDTIVDIDLSLGHGTAVLLAMYLYLQNRPQLVLIKKYMKKIKLY